MRLRLLILLALLAAPSWAATLPTQTPDVIVSGTLSVACADASINACAANSTVKVALAGENGCGVVVPTSSTLVGVLQTDYSMDGNVWTNTVWVDYAGNAVTSTATASGTGYNLSAALGGGARFCRVRAGAVTSGTATSTISATTITIIGNAIQGILGGQAIATTGTAVVSGSVGITGTVSVTGTTGGATTLSDALGNPTDAVKAGAYLLTWNGATWERTNSGGTNTDAEAVTTAGAVDVESHGMVFNGTTWDRQRGSSASGTLMYQTFSVAATKTGTCTAVTTSNNLMAVNGTRAGAIVTSLSTNTVRVRYSFAATATATQMPLEPGQSFTLDPTYKGAVSFISETGTSVTVCITEW